MLLPAPPTPSLITSAALATRTESGTVWVYRQREGGWVRIWERQRLIPATGHQGKHPLGEIWLLGLQTPAAAPVNAYSWTLVLQPFYSSGSLVCLITFLLCLRARTRWRWSKRQQGWILFPLAGVCLSLHPQQFHLTLVSPHAHPTLLIAMKKSTARVSMDFIYKHLPPTGDRWVDSRLCWLGGRRTLWVCFFHSHISCRGV